ncbi:MAG: restriction endonuclease subunit S [Acidiferrobacterales bacterium]|nr:restriction endonuclease subunit S [Acidiferrobacterales bacterium]
MMREAKALVPKLRFPEFQNAGKWKVETLRHILNAEVSEAFQNKLEFVENGYCVYGASGLVGQIKTYEQDEDYIAIVKDGSGVGRLYLHEKFTSVLGTLTYLKLRHQNNHNLIWIYHLLSTLDLSKYVVGTGIPHIYFKDYSNESVPVPSLQEQRKIADCLGSLDDLIAAESRKIETLSQHKQGLMQQLFPSFEVYGQ